MGWIGPFLATTSATSSRWSSIDSRIQVLAASSPSARTSSVTLGAPAS